MTAEPIARVRISLEEIEPGIWRRVEVPLALHLKGLHDVIQAAFGWLDRHLFEFEIGRERYGIPDPDWRDGTRQARTVRLAALLAKGIDRLDYLYDFGDGWRHAVVVEATGADDPAVDYPRFVAGARRAPPEDVGGPPGFFLFREAAADPRHRDHRRMIEWYGSAFDPEDIALPEVHRRLAALARRRRDGLLGFARSGRLRRS